MDKLTILKASSNAAACELDGGAAVLDLSTGVYFKLNSTASYFYSILEQPISLSVAIQKMTDHFDVDELVLESDIRLLADDLLNKGLIVIEG